MPRRKKSDMQLMTIEQQQEVQQRLTTRKDVNEAVKRLIAALKELLDNDEKVLKGFIAEFQARGHKGQYHENPNDTARRRMLAAQVKVRLKETPLNWMGAIELSYNLQRIDRMAYVLGLLSKGEQTLEEIADLYEIIGDEIREQVHANLGHWPEEFPIPRDRMTGDESDDLFKLADYQPQLFDEG